MQPEVHGRQHRSRWRDKPIVAMPTCHERQVYSTGVLNEEFNLECLKQSRWGEGQDSVHPKIGPRASRWRKNYKARILLEARWCMKLKGNTRSCVLYQHAIIRCFRYTYFSIVFNCSLYSGIIRACFHNDFLSGWIFTCSRNKLHNSQQYHSANCYELFHLFLLQVKIPPENT